MTEINRFFDFGDGEGLVRADPHPNGGGWVAHTATVKASAYVDADAHVYGSAIVGANACVRENARVYGNAEIQCGAIVCGNARVFGGGVVPPGACVDGKAYVKHRVDVTTGLCRSRTGYYRVTIWPGRNGLPRANWGCKRNIDLQAYFEREAHYHTLKAGPLALLNAWWEIRKAAGIA